ncbi:MAG: hypothetical protein ACO1Q7_07970 [Gemmatimonas sp.]
MRNPTRRRNLSLALTIASALTLGTTLILNRGRSPVDGTWFALAIGSFFVALGAAVAVITLQVHARWIARLKRGDDRLAQWTVSPAEWAQFAAEDQRWRDEGRINSVAVAKQNATNGVDVTIAKTSLMVGDDFYHLGALRTLQWIPSTPPCLEYNMVTHSKNGTIKWNIRFPVASGADAPARAVWDYVHRPVPADVTRSISTRRIARAIGLLVGVTCTVMFVIGWVLRTSPAQHSETMWALIIGLVGTPIGIFVAGLCHVQLKGLMREVAARGKGGG